MHPLEFVALNMRPRQKVRVHYKEWGINCKTTKTIECFYMGMKHIQAPSTKIIHSLNNLRPVFNQPGTTGGPGRRNVEAYILFEDIISIEFDLEHNDQPLIMPEEINGYMQGVDKATDIALYQIQSITEEMANLFDGKPIQLNESLGVATVSESHGGVDYTYPADIIAISYDRDALHINLELGGEFFNGQKPYDNIIVNDPVYLLSELMDSIRYPYHEETLEGTIPLDKMGWKEIPEADPIHSPVLYKTGLLAELRCDKWFDSLMEEQKRKIFRFADNRVLNTFVAGNNQKPNTALEAINYFWSGLKGKAKTAFFKQNQPV